MVELEKKISYEYIQWILHDSRQYYTCLTPTNASMVIYSKIVAISTRALVTSNAVSTDMVTTSIANIALIHIC